VLGTLKAVAMKTAPATMAANTVINATSYHGKNMHTNNNKDDKTLIQIGKAPALTTTTTTTTAWWW
jgi:hypothetical protein